MKQVFLTSYSILLIAGMVFFSAPAFGALKTEQPAPAFSLADIGGKMFTLPETPPAGKNKGIVLSFFATWCIPCRNELPILNAMTDRLAQKGIRVVIVAVRENRDTVASFLAGLRVDKPLVLFDLDAKVANQYQVRFFPMTFFIGADGTVKDIIFGEISDEQEVQKSIRKMIQ